MFACRLCLIHINKIYNVTLYLHCQTWRCWQQTIYRARIYFKGDKSWQKNIWITRENLCHRYSAHVKSFETGIVPVARYSHLLSRVLFKDSTHWLFTQNKAFSYHIKKKTSTLKPSHCPGAKSSASKWSVFLYVEHGVYISQLLHSNL